jgi:tetratricopeptide (TPR) repeat protein
MKNLLWLVCIILLVYGCSMNAEYGFKQLPTEAYHRVELATLIQNPSPFVNSYVSFKAIFNTLETTYAPLFTHFAPDSYTAFSIWSPEVKIWTQERATGLLLFAFINKDNTDIGHILSARPYTILEISGQVRFDLNKYPWIEVHTISPKRKAYDDEAVSCLTNAHKMLQEGKYLVAKECLTNALKHKIMPTAEFFIRSNLGKIYQKEGKLDLALEQYRKALAIKPSVEIMVAKRQVEEKLRRQEIIAKFKVPKVIRKKTPIDYEAKIEELERRIAYRNAVIRNLKSKVEKLLEEKKQWLRESKR